MLKRILLALVALGAVALPVTLAASPADAATTSTTSAPSTYTYNVNKGGTIKVSVNAHGSKVLNRTSTLWQNGHRIGDWSPAPGAYTIKSVLRYQAKTTTRTRVWHADVECYGDYDENGDWDPDLDCEDYGWWTTKSTTTLGPKKSVTRYNYARVASDETPGCVSHPEFKAVKDGMTQDAVHRMFGTSGRVTNRGSGGTTREYTTCAGDQDWSYVEVDYNPRVWFKWEYISY